MPGAHEGRPYKTKVHELNSSGSRADVALVGATLVVAQIMALATVS